MSACKLADLRFGHIAKREDGSTELFLGEAAEDVVEIFRAEGFSTAAMIGEIESGAPGISVV